MIRKAAELVLEVLAVTRIVAAVGALDGAAYPPDAVIMRTAPDDAMVIGGGAVEVEDPHAIIQQDSGWTGVWVNAEPADAFLRTSCAWAVPDRPSFAQGMIAGLAIKLWQAKDRTLFVFPTALTADFVERTPPEWSA